MGRSRSGAGCDKIGKTTPITRILTARYNDRVRVVGIDPSSKYAGLALIVNGELRSVNVWKPSSKRLSHPRRLVEYERWLLFKLKMLRPDMVAIEELAVYMNKRTIRVLSHFECTAILTAKKCVKSVVLITATEARGIVFNQGNMSKDDAWDLVCSEWDFDFGRKDVGGTDKMDAAVIGLAAPEFIERG
jgi:Holliday junction resolvasome RuvABC endonuclease subunit